MQNSFRNIWSIIFVSTLLGLLYNYLNPHGIEIIKKEKKIEVYYDSLYATGITLNDDNLYSGNSSELKVIHTQQAFQLFQLKTVLFIDSRDQWDFNESHIKGAINIPEYKFDPDNPLVSSLNRSKIYVIYCEGDDCDVSKRLAEQLSQIGFSQLLIYLGGFDDWLKNNYPSESNLN